MNTKKRLLISLLCTGFLVHNTLQAGFGEFWGGVSALWSAVPQRMLLIAGACAVGALIFARPYGNARCRAVENTTLDLSNTVMTSDLFAQFIAQDVSAERCAQITALNLSGCDLSNFDAAAEAALARFTNLRSLNLSRNRALNRVPANLMELLPHLTCLSISRCTNLPENIAARLIVVEE